MKLDGKKITRVRAFTLTVRNECKDTFFDIDFYQKKDHFADIGGRVT